MPNYGYDIYMRRCRRCNNIYRTSGRCSKVCPNCVKPLGGKRNTSNVFVRNGKFTELAFKSIKGKQQC